jgi:metal-responsive CopG/Arc/MetJ family transcriptional regulator
MRYPKLLLQRVDAVAKETGNPRTETILHLIRWALDEYDKERSEESGMRKK